MLIKNLAGMIGFVLLVAISRPAVAMTADHVNLWTGAATYTVPIDTPPGTNGVGPQLALTYNSDGGDEGMGAGWSLQGLGFIERLGPTYSAAPTYTDSDTFILNFNGSSKLVYSTGDPS